MSRIVVLAPFENTQLKCNTKSFWRGDLLTLLQCWLRTEIAALNSVPSCFTPNTLAYLSGTRRRKYLLPLSTKRRRYYWTIAFSFTYKSFFMSAAGWGETGSMLRVGPRRQARRKRNPRTSGGSFQNKTLFTLNQHPFVNVTWRRSDIWGYNRHGLHPSSGVSIEMFSYSVNLSFT